MSVLRRTLVVAMVAVAAIGATACAPGGRSGGDAGSSTPTSSGSSLDAVRPCGILTAGEVGDLGLTAPEPKETLPWSPSCDYNGEPFGVRLATNTRATVESAANQPVWATFERVAVNGRSGARGIKRGATRARSCSVMFNAGAGMITVILTETRPGGRDECAEALEIATLIEPRTPEPA